MEVLNHNQRRSARWRVVALFGVLVLLFSVVFISMGMASGSQDEGQIEKIKKEIDVLKGQHQPQLNDLKNQKRKLEIQWDSLKNDNSEAVEMKKLVSKKKKLNRELDSLKKVLKGYQESIFIMNERLEECKTKDGDTEQ